MEFHFPSGLGLANATICLAIVVTAMYIILVVKPKTKIALYGTVTAALIVLFHIVSTPPMYDVGFGNAGELFGLLICIAGLLSGYFVEVTRGKEA